MSAFSLDAISTPVEAILGPFNIPDGSVIKDFKVHVGNPSETLMDYRLWEYDPATATLTLLASISSAASGSLTTPVVGGPVVDNALKSYQVEIVTDSGAPIPDEGAGGFEVNLVTMAYEFPGIIVPPDP